MEPTAKPETLRGQMDLLEVRGAEERESAWGEYVGILARQNQAEPGDGDRLGQLMTQLEISRERMTADAAIVARAQELTTAYARLPDLQAACREARKQRDAMEKRHKTEREAARVAVHKAQTSVSWSQMARTDLQLLAARRPELFGAIGEPPRLRSPGGSVS